MTTCNIYDNLTRSGGTVVVVVQTNRIDHPVCFCITISFPVGLEFTIFGASGLGLHTRSHGSLCRDIFVFTGKPDSSQSLAMRHLMKNAGTPSPARSLTLYGTVVLSTYTQPIQTQQQQAGTAIDAV